MKKWKDKKVLSDNVYFNRTMRRTKVIGEMSAYPSPLPDRGLRYASC